MQSSKGAVVLKAPTLLQKLKRVLGNTAYIWIPDTRHMSTSRTVDGLTPQIGDPVGRWLDAVHGLPF